MYLQQLICVYVYLFWFWLADGVAVAQSTMVPLAPSV